MHVRLLGPVSAEAGGVALPLGGRKQRAVFALLALNANRTVSLDRLVHEVWRDEPPARATLALQSYISRLRRMLATSIAQSDREPRILTRPPGWLFELPDGQIDAMRFAELVEHGRRLVDDDAPVEGAACLREGLALWSGDPLSDLDEEPFAVNEAARLQQLRLAATESLFEAELAAGEAASVVERARRFIEENAFRERAWCALMLSLYRSGRQADALAAARELRESLSEGLGLDPSPEARRLEERILRQDPSLEVRPAARTGASASRARGADQAAAPDEEHGSDRGASAVGEATGAGVVGRDGVLGRLDGAVAKAVERTGGLVTLEGPAGMGKSTVLQVLADRVRRAGGTVLHGAGAGAGSMPALWPWVTIVRQLAATAPHPVGGPHRDASASALTLLDPSVGRGAEPGSAWNGADPALARTRLFRAVIDLIADANDAAPVTVLLDDAHWLDTESLSLLSLAVEELAARGVLFAAAFRSDEPAALRSLLDTASRITLGSVLRLQLDGLDVAAVARVVQRISAAEADPAVAAAVHERTAGNPFFVVELVQLLTSERRLDTAGVYAFLPTEVRDVLRRRLDRLPEQTLTLLTVAALVARPVSVELLVHVTGLDDDAVLDGCEAAVLAGLLFDNSSTTAGFALSHDLVRQTLDESLSEARRVRLHARIARALQQAERRGIDVLPEQIVEIARHLSLATAVVGPAEAVPYLIAAADDALSRLAFRQAEQSLRTALDLLVQIPVVVQRVQFERQVRRRLNMMLLITPNATRSQRLSGVKELEPDAVTPLDVDAPGDWWAATLFLIATGENLRAVAAAEAALIADLPPQAAVAAHSLLGYACFVLGRFEAAEPSLQLTESLTEHGSGSVIPGAFSVAVGSPALRSAMAFLRGDNASADRLLATARTRAGQSAPSVVIVEYFTAWQAACAGDAETTDNHSKACVDLASGLGNSLYVHQARVLSGWTAAMRGDRDGLATADDACEQYIASGLRYHATVMLHFRAEAHAHHGDLVRARGLVLEARAMAAITGERTLDPRSMRLADQLVKGQDTG